MSYVFTFVTRPSVLDQSLLTKITSLCVDSQECWLSPSEAIDISLPTSMHNKEEVLSLYSSVKQALSSYPIDIFLTSIFHRRKKLLIADMDSTIVNSETLDDLASEVGIGEKIAAITKRAMNGELVFADALKERIALLKGVSADLLEATWKKTHLNEGAKTLIATMKKHHAHTALVSGGFTFFTQRVADQCGFDENYANQLSIKNNQLDGTVIPPILGKEAKLFHLNRLTQSLNIDIAETVTIGDGANDLPMLTHAGLGIGYYPKPVVKKEVINIIEHTSLRSALFAQGYHHTDFC
ncbi:phosphoserine phosphatase SerB [Commensalibacter oyaizuii]|uniref:Phosphoserine phosphatase n=1 Tax=Commensalibacter oyaizuii TaxID=3043873 RepID=A0ABT6PYY7_9PROT|nr:phosphoserine phosphatase SerB [Commensalibacter sp. TBRC 16381]MDI2089943.1 phosphoserine phosphatase SerB [Commensalibacter sp. TBRC 16381]